MPRSAPALRLQGGHDARWQWLCRVLSLTVVAGTAAWCTVLARQGTPLTSAHVVIPLLACGLSTAVWWPPKGPWELRWDGLTWSFNGTPSHARATLDVGRWMLLAIHPASVAKPAHALGRPRWLALSRDKHAAGWHGLRCALYCARPHSPHLPGDGAAPTPDER